MGVLLGGIDVAKVSVENEFRIAVLEQIIEALARRGQIQLSEAEMSAIHQQTLAKLRTKYPDLGLQFEQNQQQ